MKTYVCFWHFDDPENGVVVKANNWDEACKVGRERLIREVPHYIFESEGIYTHEVVDKDGRGPFNNRLRDIVERKCVKHD